MKRKYLVLLVLIAGIGLFLAATSVNYTRLTSSLSVSEQLTTGVLDEIVKHKELNEIINFRPTSDTVTTDVDTVYSAQLTSGSTIDLTSLTSTLGNSMDLTGQRIMAIKFKNSSTTGSDVIQIDSSSTNGYPLFGSAFKIELAKNQSILYKCDTALTNVDASNLNIDYVLNGDTLEVILISARLY